MQYLALGSQLLLRTNTLAYFDSASWIKASSHKMFFVTNVVTNKLECFVLIELLKVLSKTCELGKSVPQWITLRADLLASIKSERKKTL